MFVIALEDESCHGMRRFELTVNDFIANGRPTDLKAELHSQVVFLKQPKLMRHDDRRTVIERHEAYAADGFGCGQSFLDTALRSFLAGLF